MRQPAPTMRPRSRTRTRTSSRSRSRSTQLRAMVARGEIVDLKTVAGLALIADRDVTATNAGSRLVEPCRDRLRECNRARVPIAECKWWRQLATRRAPAGSVDMGAEHRVCRERCDGIGVTLSPARQGPNKSIDVTRRMLGGPTRTHHGALCCARPMYFAQHGAGDTLSYACRLSRRTSCRTCSLLRGEGGFGLSISFSTAETPRARPGARPRQRRRPWMSCSKSTATATAPACRPESSVICCVWPRRCAARR